MKTLDEYIKEKGIKKTKEEFDTLYIKGIDEDGVTMVVPDKSIVFTDLFLDTAEADASTDIEVHINTCLIDFLVSLENWVNRRIRYICANAGPDAEVVTSLEKYVKGYYFKVFPHTENMSGSCWLIGVDKNQDPLLEVAIPVSLLKLIIKRYTHE